MAQNYFATHTTLTCHVFAGVGAYEFEKVANFSGFGAYLHSKNYNSLTYKIVLVPGVGHGAAQAPVMQSALKFAYCRTHQPITISKRQLAKYAGNYRTQANPSLKIRLYVQNKSLYLQVGDIKTLHYLPYAKDKFFMYEDEKVEVSFKNNGGKPYALFTTLDAKSERMDKIN